MRMTTLIATSTLTTALALQFLGPGRLDSPGTALSEQVLSQIRGASDTVEAYDDDCAYYNIQVWEVTWYDCAGQPDNTTNCIKCVNGVFRDGMYVPSNGGWTPNAAYFDCYTLTKMVGKCIGGVCQNQSEQGNCNGSYNYYSVQ